MTGKKIGKAFIYIILILTSLCMVFPFIWMILSSFKTPVEIIQFPPKFLPSGISFVNYAKAFEMAPFGRYFLNSILVMICSVVFTTGASVLCAFAFSRLHFPGREMIFSILLSVMMVPFEILLLPLYRMLIKAHLTDTYFGVILPYLVPPFMIFFFRQYVLGLPKELLEAARIDGCSDYCVFFRIIVPNMIPAYGAMTILSCMNSWNNLLWPLIVLNSNEKFTIPIGMGTTITPYGNAFDVLMPGAVMAVVPIIIVYLFAQKTFIAGLTSGSVKG